MRQSITPLVACQWGQYSPYYNNLKMAGKYQLVGCTALAIAQIAYYWMIQRGYHRGCKSTPKYATAKGYAIESLPPLTVFDWKILVAKPKTSAEKKAVAILCEYIAKALRSDFGTSSEGTSAKRTSVVSVVNNYLRLGSARQVYQATVGKEEFDRLIYEDLAHGRPVYMSATSDGGHSYIIDGYKDGKYHVNWGWNGQFDGYFSLNSLKVDGRNYNGSKMAVINIEPTYILGDANGDGVINISDVMTVLNTKNATKQTDINSDGKVTKEDAEIIEGYLLTGEGL